MENKTFLEAIQEFLWKTYLYIYIISKKERNLLQIYLYSYKFLQDFYIYQVKNISQLFNIS